MDSSSFCFAISGFKILSQSDSGQVYVCVCVFVCLFVCLLLLADAY